MSPSPNRNLTYKQAIEHFRYDEKTGRLFWRKTRTQRLKPGDEAGTPDRDGYRNVSWSKRIYKVHRVIWLMTHGHWPKHEIDHINGRSDDNRPENLRDVPRKVNHKNMAINRRNSSGYMGVYWQKDRKRWAVYATINYKRKMFGRFKTKDDAINKRQQINKEFGFHDNHGRPK